MSVIGWDEPYPHNVVRLSTRRHVALRRSHLCAECFKDIEIGERYVCTAYRDGQKISEYKVHEVCPYTWNVLALIEGWWRGS
jgi:hypothetical protein